MHQKKQSTYTIIIKFKTESREHLQTKKIRQKKRQHNYLNQNQSGCREHVQTKYQTEYRGYLQTR